MPPSTKRLSKVNEIVYVSLDGILRKLNKRMHIRLYALVYDEKADLKEMIRVKKTAAGSGGASPISQDKLQNLTDMYGELKVDAAHIAVSPIELADFKRYFDQAWNRGQTDAADDVDAAGRADSKGSPRQGPDVQHVADPASDTRIMYANQFKLEIGKALHTIIYLLEIRNVEREARQLFFKQPEVSFLRMALDYFFLDFFAVQANAALSVHEDGSIERKYKEDGLQFNRRMTRLFFGKMQGHLEGDESGLLMGASFEHPIRSEYYVRNLLEKMDDISSQTYEGASPFGSILFMNKLAITKGGMIRFTIRFMEGGRIRLDDSKRIRKLLELTNVDKDLYLIADHSYIYGLGEVNWNLQKGALALRLDFNGLSKYNLVLVHTEAEQVKEGKLIVEDEKKFFRSDLSLIENRLISVSFKNPRIGEEGYTPEKLAHLLKSEFWQDEEEKRVRTKIGVLDHIVRKAREQKHGTMVVITDSDTAGSELKTLSKQSTLIEPDVINPEYMKYLTSIDGAIYVDTDGHCHAIGVILDGIAKEDIGDASRGARFNSAHRYLEKLRAADKKCVIAIISEDGMVDLIPELENEDKLLALAQEIIDSINEEHADAEKLSDKEAILLQSRLVDCDWLFQVGAAYYEKKCYDRALDFFDYGISRAGKGFVPAKYYNLKGNCHYMRNDEMNYGIAIEMYEQALARADSAKSKQVFYGNLGSSSYELSELYRNGAQKHDSKKCCQQLEKTIHWLGEAIELGRQHKLPNSFKNYNQRGLSCDYLSGFQTSKRAKVKLTQQAVEDYTSALEVSPNSRVAHWNRALSYKDLGKMKESIEDLIRAEMIVNEDDDCIQELHEIFTESPAYVADALAFYSKLAANGESSKPLEKLFREFGKKIPSNQAETAAGKEPS